ncbi:MAG: type I 3-dehydroquinate dehydratase [Planctomycetes bacterium]|nr:type I 3-dehydroquinate dehydratase [Planctomycetota bacterium]
MTRIAVPIFVRDSAEVAAALGKAQRAAADGARLIEWRVDGLPNESAEGIQPAIDLIKESPLPCILTRRTVDEGGECTENDIQRGVFFSAIAHCGFLPKFFDFELASFQKHESSWRSVLNIDEHEVSLILSCHDFDGRPADLIQRVEAMTNEPACDVIKLVWMARSLRDNLEAFDLLSERRKPMIALCMGRFGLMSRVLAPKFGGLVTYACLETGEASAPGQPTVEELQDLYRFDRIGPATKVYGVIGWPVEHSLGPRIHNAGFEAVEHDGVYLPLPIPPEYEHFKATVGSFVDHERLDFRGASVTIPHKENLLRFVKERGGTVDPLAERIGAANTLVVEDDGTLACMNTDAPAAIDALCKGMEIQRAELDGRRVAVLGAGGVARAVVTALCDAGASVVIFNRTKDRAETLVAQQKAATVGRAGIDVGDVDALAQGSAGRFQIYINCTSLGMAGGPGADQSPLPDNAPLDEDTTVFDTVYTPCRTPLIRHSEARGARTIFGVEMFLAQAAMQFEHWTGKPAPMDVFRKAVEGPA